MVQEERVRSIRHYFNDPLSTMLQQCKSSRKKRECTFSLHLEPSCTSIAWATARDWAYPGKTCFRLQILLRRIGYNLQNKRGHDTITTECGFPTQSIGYRLSQGRPKRSTSLMENATGHAGKAPKPEGFNKSDNPWKCIPCESMFGLARSCMRWL